MDFYPRRATHAEEKPHLRWEFPGLPIPRRIANEARRWRVKKLLTMTRMPPKSFLFLAESNLVEAANTSSSASRRTRRARVMSGVCDYCSSAEALVCCRADSARLCLSCDAWVRPCPLGKRRPARFSAALRWVRHSARGDRRARGLRARAGRERAAVASSRRFSLVMPRSAPGDDAQSRARRVFRPARHVVNRRRGAHLFPR